MTALEVVWYAVVLLSTLLAGGDWRKAVYLGIILDAVRDPVRKVIPSVPVAITVSGVVPWIVIVVAGAFSRPWGMSGVYRFYPRLRAASQLLLLALLPAALLSTISYAGGWQMAAIGAVSYIVPALGIAAGFGFVRNEADVLRMLKWYVIVNSLMLLSVPLEYMDVDVPGLGGIQVDWIRNRTGYNVDLIAGWYRSPDIMGLHAAHVIMFSLLIAARSTSGTQVAWLPIALWAGFCVLVSGRRKMIGIPLVFLATYVLVGMQLGVRKTSRLAGFAVVAALLGGAVTLVFWSPDEAAGYTEYASSLFTEGVSRGSDVILGSTIVTLQQAGILGGGLGTATQGRHYTGVQTARHLRGWQEDGVSRLFLEFGVTGVILLIGCIYLLFIAVRKALRLSIRQSSAQLLQVGLVGVIAGDAASFAISHQQFSGDPVSALLVTMIVGMILRLPTLSRDPQGRLLPTGSFSSGRVTPYDQQTTSLISIHP